MLLDLTMPIYHFNLHDGKSYPDADGMELPDLKAARIEAVRHVGGLLRDGAEEFWNGDEWTLTVTDDSNLALFSLTFMATDAPAALRIKPTAPPRPD